MKEIYTDEEYLKFYYRDFLNAEKALYESKGGVCINYLNNIKLSYTLCDSYIYDLIESISKFQIHLFDENRNSIESDIVFKDYGDIAVQKCLFSSIQSIAALIDHTRNFIQLYPIKGYNKKLEEIKNNEVVLFLKQLRNYYSHYHFLKTHWQGGKDFRNGTEYFRFILNKDDLLLFSDWSAKNKKYISEQPVIDIKSIFSEYRTLINKLYPWLFSKVFIDYCSIIEDYFHYLNLSYSHKNMSKNKIYLQVITKKDDYNISRFVNEVFNEKEKIEYYSLPNDSQEQTDYFFNVVFYGIKPTEQDILMINQWKTDRKNDQ